MFSNNGSSFSAFSMASFHSAGLLLFNLYFSISSTSCEYTCDTSKYCFNSFSLFSSKLLADIRKSPQEVFWNATGTNTFTNPVRICLSLSNESYLALNVLAVFINLLINSIHCDLQEQSVEINLP